jgi:hypothetical protein
MKHITRKIGRGILSTSLVAMVLASTACGGGPIGGQTQSGGDIGGKERITFSVYNGGTGTQWIEDMANVWNKTSEKYHITIRPEKIDYLMMELQTTPTADAYYTADASYFSAVKQGLLEDLSDILTLKMNGDTKTIGQKFEAVPDWYNDWKKIGTNNGQGMYLFPYADMFNGISFDYRTLHNYGTCADFYIALNGNSVSTGKFNSVVKQLIYYIKSCGIIQHQKTFSVICT